MSFVKLYCLHVLLWPTINLSYHDDFVNVVCLGPHHSWFHNIMCSKLWMWDQCFLYKHEISSAAKSNLLCYCNIVWIFIIEFKIHVWFTSHLHCSLTHKIQWATIIFSTHIILGVNGIVAMAKHYDCQWQLKIVKHPHMVPNFLLYWIVCKYVAKDQQGPL